MSDGVGSVSVDVVPDARQFWSTFREQTRADAGRVGSELGRPMGDAMGTAAGRAARLRIEEHLRGIRADVDVNLNQNSDRIRQLERDLADLQSRLNGVRGNQGNGAQGARREMHLLLTAVAALAPAIIPLGAALTGLFTGAVASGGTAVLAILGIKDAMSEGTKIGQQYQQVFSPVVDEFTRLKDIAAAGVFGGISKAINEIKPSFGQVELITHGLAVQLGTIAGNVGSGLVGLFRALAPLFSTLGDALVRMTKHFSDWANSSGAMKGFVSYVEAELPHVEQFMSNLMTTVGHLAQAFAPFGGFVLDALSGFASIINSMPIGVLQVLVPLIIGLKVAMLGMRAVTGVVAAIAGFRAAILYMSTTARVATLAMGGIGIALTAAAVIYSAFTGNSQAAARAQQEMKTETQSLTQALKESNGAIDESVQAQIRKKLIDDGVLDAAKQLGISQDLVTKAALGNKGAQEKVNTALLAYKGTALDVAGVTGKVSGAVNVESTALKNAQVHLKQDKDATEKAAAARKQQITTLNDVAKATGVASEQAKDYAAMLGYVADQDGNIKGSAAEVSGAVNMVATAYQFASQTGDEFLGALKTFSSSAGTAADRAALIGATLKAANGDALNYATQMNASASANQNLVDSLKSAAKQVGKSGESVHDYVKGIVNLKTGTINYMKAGAAPLISGLGQIQSSAMTAAQATYQHYLATMDAKSAADQAYKVYVGQTRGSLIDQASKLGLTKHQATLLADAYFGMPKDVKTKIEQEGGDPIKRLLGDIKGILVAIAKAWGITVNADTAAAAARIADIKRKIKGLDGWTVDTYVDVHVRNNAGKPAHIPGLPGVRAAGGPIDGPGQKGVDSLPFLLAPGEYVINDKAVDKFGLGFMESINKGVMPWAQSSPAAAPAAAPTRVGGGMHIENMTLVTPNPQAAVNELQRRQRLLAV